MLENEAPLKYFIVTISKISFKSTNAIPEESSTKMVRTMKKMTCKIITRVGLTI